MNGGRGLASEGAPEELRPARDRPEVLFVAPSPGMLRAGAEWVVIKNWLEGARARWGSARILTPGGYLDDDQIQSAAWGSDQQSTPRSSRGSMRTIAETAVKDVRSLIRMARFDRSVNSNRLESDPILVWQYHSLFQTAGLTVGRQTKAPVVLYVAAPQVWEASSWGVTRPLWGTLVERFGESPQFARADLVACLSEDVAEATIARGAVADRVIVTPCTADAVRESPSTVDMRRRLGFDNQFVVGWVGSFRPFHNAEMLVRVVARLQRERNVGLLMIGNGPTHGACVDLASSLGLRKAVFPGAVPHHEIREFLGAIDVGVITSKFGGQFHYSPLKLKEYLAAGRAVVAPAVGEVARIFEDGHDLLMYPAGDESEMAEVIGRIIDEPELRLRMETQGQRTYDLLFTMRSQLDLVSDRLGLPLPGSVD